MAITKTGSDLLEKNAIFGYGLNTPLIKSWGKSALNSAKNLFKPKKNPIKINPNIKNGWSTKNTNFKVSGPATSSNRKFYPRNLSPAPKINNISGSSIVPPKINTGGGSSIVPPKINTGGGFKSKVKPFLAGAGVAATGLGGLSIARNNFQNTEPNH